MKLRFPRFRFGLFTTLIALFALIALILFTPLSEIIVRLIPAGTHLAIFKNVYQEITLLENTETLEKEIQFSKTLPVLGTQTGICFEFKAGDLTVGQLKQAKRNKIVADIISIGTNGNPYQLTDMVVTKTPKKTAIICQQLGKLYSTTPDEMIAISIKPIKPFTPTRIFWTSTMDFFSFRPPEYTTTFR